MQNTNVPFFFDYTSYTLHIETTTTTENHLIPVDLSLEPYAPLPVNLSVLPHYAQLPDYDTDPVYLDPVTIQPVQEGIICKLDKQSYSKSKTCRSNNGSVNFYPTFSFLFFLVVISVINIEML